MVDLVRFQDFWPYYLQEHARPATRALHYIGTGSVIALVVASPVTHGWWMMAALPIMGYGFAWAAHGLVERNRPATFRYPFWSLRADFVMFFRFVTGRLRRDLEEAGVRPDGTVDPQRRILA